MQFQTPFDARSVDPASFAPPPPMADYHVRIIESEAKPTNDNTGGYLEFTFEILDPGPYLNRHIPYRLNLYNKSQQTVEIAYRQLSALCHVCNVFQVQDSRQLHNIPFIALIGPQKDNPQYSNVFMVKDVNGNAPGLGNATTQPAARAAAAPSWAAPVAPQVAPAPVAAAPAWSGPPSAAEPSAGAWGGAPPPTVPPTAAPAWQQQPQAQTGWQPPAQNAQPAQFQPGTQAEAPPWARK